MTTKREKSEKIRFLESLNTEGDKENNEVKRCKPERTLKEERSRAQEMGGILQVLDLHDVSEYNKEARHDPKHNENKPR